MSTAVYQRRVRVLGQAPPTLDIIDKSFELRYSFLLGCLESLVPCLLLLELLELFGFQSTCVLLTSLERPISDALTPDN